MFLKKHPAESKAFFVFVTALVTVLVVIFVQNFHAGERGAQRQIPRLYSVHDSAFDRAMGLTLGPSIVGGNQVVVLLNGDEIFPSMLQDIQSAQKTITMETISTGRVTPVRNLRQLSPNAPGPESKCTCWSTRSAAARWTRAMCR
jgi:hypothetical protein